LSIKAASFALAQEPKSVLHLRPAADSEERQFLSPMIWQMSNMNRNMLVTPTGDIDRDFATIMIPHHQGAIDMAEAELKYGHDSRLRRLAEQIVAQQQQEISILRRATGETAVAGALTVEHRPNQA
jgi:uncharacterized protein (DUF305 family)